MDISYNSTKYISQDKSNKIERTIRDTNNTPNKVFEIDYKSGYDGHMLPILINYKVIHHRLTY